MIFPNVLFNDTHNVRQNPLWLQEALTGQYLDEIA